MRLAPAILNTDESLVNGPIIMVRFYLILLAFNYLIISAEAEFHKRMVPDIKTLQFRCVLIESDQALVRTSDQPFQKLSCYNSVIEIIRKISQNLILDIKRVLLYMRGF